MNGMNGMNGMDKKARQVIFASSLGTVFEWYDFYLYGSLAVFFSGLFFPPGNETAAFLASLAVFGAGFGVRPFGALLFGRLGDLIGRKHTFLVTIVVMGLSTAAVGILPTYEQIGLAAPVLLVVLRLLQGLALGGEYGGAATYVAEHAPDGKRGLYTSFIQTTATLGFFLSLAVILACRSSLSADDFKSWGWRLPFLLSVILLGVSVYIRLRLEESPVFQRMKARGQTSKSPLRDSFLKWENARLVWLSLFGATAGQGVVWYTGQFYALFFLTASLRVDYVTAYLVLGAAMLLGTPLFVVFGRLSDRVGRKPIMLAGMLLCALTCVPIFQGLTRAANPALALATERSPVVVSGEDCHFNLFAKPSTPCDRARDTLSKSGVGYKRLDPTGEPRPGAQSVMIRVGEQTLLGFDEVKLREALSAAGYPTAADPERIDHLSVILLLTLLIVYVTLVYGPIAALLVELFPTRIRYTSMSLPYHLGNGWFGGFLPFFSFAIVMHTGDPYSGLWYPIGVAIASFVVGLIFLPETKDRPLED